MVEKIGTPVSPGAAGETARSAAKSASERFVTNIGKKYDDVFDEIGAEAPVDITALSMLRTELLEELTRAPKALNADYQPALRMLDNLLADHAEGALVFGGLRQVRTGIGKNLDKEHYSGATSAQNGINKRIYGALTEDLSKVAEAASPKIAARLKGLDKEFRRWKTGSSVTMDKILNLQSDEKVFNYIYMSARDNARALGRMRGHFNDDEWSGVVATVLHRMGRAKDSVQDASGDVFSVGTFMTSWSKLSPEAKKILFKNTQFGGKGGVVDELDNLAKVVSALKSANAVSNTSNTARTLLTYSLISGLGTAGATAMTGDIYSGTASGAALVGGAIIAPRTAAKLITSPVFVKWLATPIKDAKNGLGAHLGRLAAIAKANPEIKDEIMQYLNVFRDSPVPASEAAQ